MCLHARWSLPSPLPPTGTLGADYQAYVNQESGASVTAFALARITRLAVFPLFLFLVLYLAFWLTYALLGEVSVWPDAASKPASHDLWV